MAEFNDNQMWIPDFPLPVPPIPARNTAVVSHIGSNNDYNSFVVSTVGKGTKGDKGDKGDPFKYSDFTEQQIDDLKQGILFSGNKTLDCIVTTDATVSEITIPIPNFDEFDMLFVDVNGLDLCEHEDYEISGNKIILSTPIPSGQDVHFKAIRYEIPNSDKYILKSSRDYNTVAEMRADTELETGDICHVLGSDGNNGGWYVIKSTGEADGYNIIQLDNGVYAHLVKDDTDTGSIMNISVMSSKYGMTLVQAGGKNIVFECGSSDYPEDIASFFSKHGVSTGDIDVLVITHFHADHYSGINYVVPYCDSETDTYIQMPVPSTNDDFVKYTTGLNVVSTALHDAGMKNPVVPENAVTHKYGQVKITFFNTDETAANAYKFSYANTTNAIDLDTGDGNPASVTRMTSLNNYSLITRVEYGGNVYTDCGDIEGEAQKQMCEYMQPTTIMSNPHHLVNRMGYIEFFNRLNPSAMIATHNEQGLNIDMDDIDANSMFYYYVFRYLLYLQNGLKLHVNIGEDIEVVLDSGFIKSCSSNKEYAYYSFGNNQITVPAILPPNYYNDDPFYLYTMSLDNFYNIKLAAQFYPKFTFNGNVSWSNIGKMQFILDIKELFEISSNYDIGKNFFIDFIDLPKIKFHNSTWNYNIIELLANFNMQDFRQGAVNYKRYSFGDTPIKVEGPWTSGSTMAEASFQKINNAEQIIVILDLGGDVYVSIPLLKINESPLQGNLVSAFAGTMLNADATAIYSARISALGIISSNRVVLSSGTVTDHDIKEILVVR